MAQAYAHDAGGIREKPLHILLTVLGTNPRMTRYSMGGRECEAQVAPIALIDLLPEEDRPDRVVALCTDGARKSSLPPLRAGLGGVCAVEAIDVPDGRSQEELREYLSIAADAIPPGQGVELTVDLTHGYRHFVFLTYVVLLYLTGLRDVTLRSAHYGLLTRDGASPFLDLGPLLALPRWFHALEALGESGTALPMAAILGEAPSGRSARRIARDLSMLSDGYLSGLPLELGRQAQLLRDQQIDPLRRILDRDHRLPLARELTERLAEILGSFAFEDALQGEGWKREVGLTQAELDRQAGLIDDLLCRGGMSTALGLMSEWVVSWVVWRTGEREDWLDYARTRRKAAARLTAISQIAEDSALRHLLSSEQAALGGFWTHLRELRNGYHHHGMRVQDLVADRGLVKKYRELTRYWEECLRGCPAVSLDVTADPGGCVLVSPIGRRPGVLFSALHACEDSETDPPATCLVICSKETEGLIEEAVERAGFEGAVERLVLSDAFAGRDEVKGLVEAARPHLVTAEEVFVNVTGGTTLMGLVAERVADTARRLARPVRRFGLIDRRGAEQQSDDPYRIGEPLWLERGGTR